MAAASLRLSFFGAFAAEIDGNTMPPLRFKRSLWLLALLALRQGRDVQRAWLAETLWPESDPSRALRNLRQLLADDLRPALGSAASVLRSPTPLTLSLETAGVWTDIAAFDTEIAADTIEALYRAVALYAGPMLEGCSEEWILPERAAREEMFYSALERIANAALANNDPAAAAGHLRRLIAASPLRETAYVALMEALSAGGDQAGVTRAYRDLRTVLRREFNSEPDELTRTLYERLRLEAHQRALPPARPPEAASRPRRLPIPLTRLIGREREIEEVRDRFTQGRLVTLLGVGGVGKTRLSIAIAELLVNDCPDGVWFVDLAPVENPNLVCNTVASVFQVEEQQRETVEESLMGSLESRSLLLILDNCEHLLESCVRFVQNLLTRCPKVRILTTSRQALGMTGEWVFRVPSLETPRLERNHPSLDPHKDRSDILLDYDAVRLFVERAAAQKERFKPTAAQVVAIAGICDLLDVIPLAIEMAAARVRSLSITSIRERLADRFALLKSGSSAVLPRHQTLRALIDWSYKLLNEQEKLLLARLSVFSGGCTLEAAEAVCTQAIGNRQSAVVSPSPLPSPTKGRGNNASPLRPTSYDLRPRDVLDLLTSLVDKSLVVFEESTAYCEARYRLLVTIREYAHEQLTDLEREHAERRHADFYLQDALRTQADVQVNETYGFHRRRMMPDGKNYRAAQQKWGDLDADTSLRMLLALDTCVIFTYDRQEREVWIDRLESQQLPVPSSLQAEHYFRIALKAKYRTARDWVSLMEKARFLAEGCGNKAIIAHAEYSLAEFDLNCGNREGAKTRFAAALECATAAGIRAQAAGLQFELISIACAEDNFAGAQQMAESLLQSGLKANHWSTTALGWHALAEVAAHREDYGRRRECLEQALAAYPETASQGRTNALSKLGTLASLQGDYIAARQHLAESLAVCAESGDVAHEGWTYLEIASCELRQENSVEAFEYARHALSIFDFLGDTSGMADSLRFMVRLERGQPDRACRLWFTYACVWQVIGYSNSVRDEEIAAAFAALQTELSAEKFAAIQAQCDSMSWRETVREAYSDAVPTSIMSALV